MISKIKKAIKYIFYIFSLDVRNPPPGVINGVFNLTFSTVMFFAIMSVELKEYLKNTYVFKLYSHFDTSTGFIVSLFIVFIFYSCCFFGGKRGRRIIDEYSQKDIRHKNTLHFLFTFLWIPIYGCFRIVLNYLIKTINF